MTEERDFESALAKAGAFIRELEDHVGYRAIRPPYHCPGKTLLNGVGAVKSVGRFDGCEKKRTVYLSASPTAAVQETKYAHEQNGKFVVYGSRRPRYERLPLCIVPVRVRLEYVLRLDELIKHSPGLLPISEDELMDKYHMRKAIEGEYVPVHALASAARKRKIQGVLYPSRYEPESQNLAVFVENIRRGSLRPLYGVDVPCRPGWWRWPVLKIHDVRKWVAEKKWRQPRKKRNDPCPD